MHTPLNFNRCINITFRTFCKNCYSRVAMHHASVYNPPKPKTLFQLISSSQASRMAIEMMASETPITSNTLKLNDKSGVWTGTVHGYQHLYSSHISVPLPHPLTWRPGVHSLKKKKKKSNSHCKNSTWDYIDDVTVSVHTHAAKTGRTWGVRL